MQLTSEDWDANVLAGNMDANVDLFSTNAKMIRDGLTYSGKEAIITTSRSGMLRIEVLET